MSAPLVSVVMPTYNRAEYLAEAIDSVLVQEFDDFELIVVDDGSTDSTRLVIRYYLKDPRFRLRLMEKNGGIAKARNAGNEIARGKYIAVMDSDDLMSPERLSLSVKAIKASKADFVYGSYLRAGKDGTVVDGVAAPPKWNRETILASNGGAPHVTIMAKASLFDEHPYDPKYKVNDDYPLLVSWFLSGAKAAAIEEPLVIVRYHDQSTSVMHAAECQKITDAMRVRLDAVQ